MKKGAKVLLGLGVFGGAIAGIVALAKRAAAAPGDALTITLYDQYGNIIKTNSRAMSLGAAPVTATEGDVISIGLGATNTSYQMLGGVQTPVAASLTVRIAASAGGITLIPSTQRVFSFGAGASLAIDKSSWSVLQFTLPIGAGGFTGTVSAQLLDPALNILASGQVSFAIARAPIVYGGTIVFA